MVTNKEHQRNIQKIKKSIEASRIQLRNDAMRLARKSVKSSKSKSKREKLK
jgi:IS1 family transposase